jgi:sarcosine oxidase subunit beta
VADVLVVGAGIVGAASAYRLAEAGLKVLLLEKEATFAQGSTGRSAAGVRVQFSEPLNVLLSYHSILEYQRIPEAGYRPIGYLFLVPEALAEAQEEALRTQKALGVPVERLSLEEAREKVPFLEEGLAFATFGPMDGVIDPHGATAFYLKEARRLGAEVRFSEPLLWGGAPRGPLAGGDPQGAVRGPLPPPLYRGLDGGGGAEAGGGDPHLARAPGGLRHGPGPLPPRLSPHH